MKYLLTIILFLSISITPALAETSFVLQKMTPEEMSKYEQKITTNYDEVQQLLKQGWMIYSMETDNVYLFLLIKPKSP